MNDLDEGIDGFMARFMVIQILLEGEVVLRQRGCRSTGQVGGVGKVVENGTQPSKLYGHALW